MSGDNGQKSKMARERNAEKNKASKGTSNPIHPYPDSPFSLALLTIQSPSDLTPSIDFISVFACRQPARDQQYSHEHSGAYPFVTILPSLFPDPVKEPPRARSGRWRPVTPIFGGGGGRGSPSYVGADWFRREKVD